LKQVLQSLKTGITTVAEIPCPAPKSGQLLIATTQTLVSAGTERMLVEFGKAGWIEKARQQPDKVRMVLDKIKTDGLLPTLEAVLNKLDQPIALGYCNVGQVLSVGAGVSGFSVGDRVVSNGKHAQVVNVPINLCAKIPDAVSDESAAFTVLGAIALQGIRLVQPSLGESVVVTGLGLIGLLTVQLLRAHGCRVLAIDTVADRLALARQFGAETVELSAGHDPIAKAKLFSRDRGVDAVILTASTKSSEPVHQAALMCRKRGRIVLVGVTGLELSRADFYEKELSFQVSCSYGPGRYDANYEEKGVDYPAGFVRWTEQRNFEAVLDMMADGRLDLAPLISHRFAIKDAEQAYALVVGTEPSLGIMLQYSAPSALDLCQTVSLGTASVSARANAEGGRALAGKALSVSFIGAGNYATAMLMPVFKKAGAQLRSVVSAAGVSGVHAGRKFGFDTASTDSDAILADADTQAVVITTRHNSHAAYTIKALEAGKHVFVEKPLCLTKLELADIETAYAKSSYGTDPQPLLMVGFNRRFAPQVQKIKQLLSTVSGPKAFIMTVNAGAIPAEHWTQDVEAGGGRLLGEACHFVDLLRFLADASIATWHCTRMQANTPDTVTIELKFVDGSIGTIHYFANGSKAFSKERLEVFVAGRVLQLDNFRKLVGFGWPGFKSMNLWRQDKGQQACAKAFVNAIAQGQPSPIDAAELFEVSRVVLDLAQV
jgi:predicted dehydrogenase/threonine dehydrogenase-like Zn-dependent dehydrogenase